MGASSKALGVVRVAGLVAAAARDYRRASEGRSALPFWAGWGDGVVFCGACYADNVQLDVELPPTQGDADGIEHEDGCAAIALERALDEMERAIRGQG